MTHILQVMDTIMTHKNIKYTNIQRNTHMTLSIPATPVIPLASTPGVQLPAYGRVSLLDENRLGGHQSPTISSIYHDGRVGYDLLSRQSGVVLGLGVLSRSSTPFWRCRVSRWDRDRDVVV